MYVLLEVLKKKCAVLKSLGEKSCEIKDGGPAIMLTLLFLHGS